MKIKIIAIAFLINGCSVFGSMKGLETPQYEIKDINNNIEVRQYKPMIVAETKIYKNQNKAMNKGFKILANYIFSNDIKMTSPVMQQSDGNKWIIQFMMPKKYTIKNLPKSDNIQIKKIDASKYLVIQFSGSSNMKNMINHKNKLLKYVQKNNISIIGYPIYNYYNPPWTIPSAKRNEVMIKIK